MVGETLKGQQLIRTELRIFSRCPSSSVHVTVIGTL